MRLLERHAEVVAVLVGSGDVDEQRRHGLDLGCVPEGADVEELRFPTSMENKNYYVAGGYRRVENPDLTDDDLRALGFEEELAEAAAAVSEGRDVAVVSEPFAGRNAVLDHVEALGDFERKSAVEHGDDSGARVRIFDECQRLYSREIDGFDRLDSFLDRMATSDDVFVTSWNEFSWRYLSATKDVSDSFEVEVSVPGVGVERISGWLEDLVERDLEYVDDSEEIPARFDPSTITSLRTLREQLRLLLYVDADEIDPRRAVFQAITRMSAGNPGVAKELWRYLLDVAAADGEIRTSTLAESEVEVPPLDYDEAFALQVIVSNEGVPRAELESIVGSELDRSLRKFVDRGIVALEEGRVGIEPVALKDVVGHLETRRMVR